MDKKGKIYVAYGSNMNIVQMAKRCPKARIRDIGNLEGYKLTFRGSSRGVANIEKCESAQVPIVLWEITADCENALDRYEGFPNLYVKKQITVMTPQGEVEAMAYVMALGYEQLVAVPQANYYDIIQKGYEQNGIDKQALYEALQNTYKEVAACKGRIKEEIE